MDFLRLHGDPCICGDKKEEKTGKAIKERISEAAFTEALQMTKGTKAAKPCPHFLPGKCMSGKSCGFNHPSGVDPASIPCNHPPMKGHKCAAKSRCMYGPRAE